MGPGVQAGLMVSAGMAASPDPTNLMFIHLTVGLDSKQFWATRVPRKCLVFSPSVSISWLFLIFPQIPSSPVSPALPRPGAQGKCGEKAQGVCLSPKPVRPRVLHAWRSLMTLLGPYEPRHEAGGGHLS